ncbi:calcineurin-like phosphoesterase [Aureococcus anophagefferens]|nr:calcineurin-like phosphoesterase [Aureococcus anophagefferens]
MLRGHDPVDDVVARVAVPAGADLRVHVLSDLHTDRPANVAWLERHLRPQRSCFEVLLCAGDVSNVDAKVRATLELLAARYDAVVFTPGNHDLWARGGAACRDSLEKLDRLLGLCRSLGIRTGPTRFVVAKGSDVLAVPLLSWYDDAFDGDGEPGPGDAPPGLDSPQHRARWVDYAFCAWGEALERAPGFRFSAADGASDHVARHFAARNEPRLAAALDDLQTSRSRPVVVTVSGSELIEAQLRVLGPDAHVFGHTHLCYDLELDGVRYVNWPLGSREMANQTRVVAGSGALVLFDGARTASRRASGPSGATGTATGAATRHHRALGPKRAKLMFQFDVAPPAVEPPHPTFPDGVAPGVVPRERAGAAWRSVDDDDDARAAGVGRPLRTRGAELGRGDDGEGDAPRPAARGGRRRRSARVASRAAAQAAAAAAKRAWQETTVVVVQAS